MDTPTQQDFMDVTNLLVGHFTLRAVPIWEYQ